MTRRRWAVPAAGRASRGSSTVLSVVVLGVLLAVAGAVALVGGLVVDQRRAEAAADLGALAGAAAGQRGEPACAAAAVVARRNGASLTGCVWSAERVSVRVARRPRRVLGLSWTATSSARAGPVPP